MDRERLHEILKLQRTNGNELVTWGTQLSFSPPLTSLSFHADGRRDVNIPVPVSDKDMGYLKKTSKQVAVTPSFDVKIKTSAECALKVNEQIIKTHPSDSFLHSVAPALATVITQKLLGLEINGLSHMIDTHLSKLLIVEKGQHVKLYSESKNKSGTFAVMVITIPVKGGYKGGQINVEKKGNTESFQFEHESGRNTSLLAFYSDCTHKLEPVTSGWMLAMVFNLVWLDACKAVDSPLEFPTFLHALNELNESLFSWASLQNKKNETPVPSSCLELQYENLPEALDRDQISEEKMDIDSGSAADSQITASASFGLTHSLSNAPQSTHDSAVPENSEKELLIFFPLHEKYDIADLTSEILLGRDRLIAHLFQSVSFLDVHLALVSQLVDAEKSYEIDSDMAERTIQISKWIDSSNSLPMTKLLLLDAQTQLVGNFSRVQDVASGPDEQKVIYYHSALVIQPRHQSVPHACRYRFNAVLDYMELIHSRIKESVTTGSRLYRNQQQQLELTLKYVIAFCRQEPVLAWMDPSSETNGRSLRIMKLCIELQAKQEGLDLLELLGIEFEHNYPKDSEDKSNDVLLARTSEGIRNTKMAEAIAIFVSQVNDWKACANAVLRLVSPALVFDQMECYTSLANSLLERKFIEGARLIADSITSIVDKLDDQMVDYFSDYQIGCFIHLIVTFETKRTTANPNRVRSVIGIFNRLKIHRQCRFINDCQEANFVFHHVNSRSSRKLFLHLCSSLAFSEQLHPSSFAFHLVSLPLIKSFIQLGDEDSLRKLIDKICLCNPNERCDDFQNSPVLLLDSILSSPYEIMYVYFAFPSGRAAVKVLQDAGIKQMERIALCQPKTPALASAQMVPTTSTFLNNNVDDLVEFWVAGIVRRIGHKDTLSSAAAMEECRALTADLVRLIVDTLTEVWVNGISRRLDVLNLDICNRILSSTIPSQEDNLAQDRLHEEVANSVQLYIRNEKGRYPAHHSNEIFFPLVNKMSTLRLSQLLVSIHQNDAKENVGLKEHPNCLHLCSFITQQFAKREDLNILFESPDDIIDVMTCLLWLCDETSLLAFVQQIFSFRSTSKNPVASNIESVFRLLLDQEIKKLEEIKPNESTGDLAKLKKLRENYMGLQRGIQETEFPDEPAALMVDEDVDMA